MSAGTSANFARDVAGRVLTADFTSPAPVWSGTTHAVYGPLGAVVYADNVTMNAGYEEFITDAIGNRTWQATRQGWDPYGYYDRQRTLTYDAAGRLTNIAPVSPPAGYVYANTPVYDEAGNTTESHTQDPNWDAGTGGGLLGETVTYHDAENRVRVVNRATDASGFGVGSMFEEYRYDALGRRVLVRMRCLHTGDANCKSYLERTVWDGNQTLYEMRVSGTDADSLNFDTAESISGDQYGRAMYVHGGGIDQPLVVYRHGAVGNEAHWVALVPHANWQGAYEVGTWASGANVGQTTSQCTLTYVDCPRTYWPGGTRHLDGAIVDRLNPPVAMYWWTGNLISAREDGSSLQYRRNRYYDPGTGRFTQEDPIGLAGGMNAYGFATGDPVNFSDPFGLAAEAEGGSGSDSDAGPCQPFPQCVFGFGSLQIALGEVEGAVKSAPSEIGDFMSDPNKGGFIAGLASIPLAAGAGGVTEAALIRAAPAMTGLTARATLAVANNPAAAWTTGFGIGVARSLAVSGATGAPRAVMLTKSMQSGYDLGVFAGGAVKAAARMAGY